MSNIPCECGHKKCSHLSGSGVCYVDHCTCCQYTTDRGVEEAYQVKINNLGKINSDLAAKCTNLFKECSSRQAEIVKLKVDVAALEGTKEEITTQILSGGPLDWPIYDMLAVPRDYWSKREQQIAVAENRIKKLTLPALIINTACVPVFVWAAFSYLVQVNPNLVLVILGLLATGCFLGLLFGEGKE